ncbi:hypothetical protein BHM03_00059078 [Ensete ventricosum]|nr:hypothetical protein BHM03_00059078 [Ensete ventricosum]
MEGVTQRGLSDAQVRKNIELPSREGEAKSSGEKRETPRERESSFFPHFYFCRNECFIPVRGELVRTLSLTFVVPRDVIETYRGRATTAAWGEGMAHHATLMGVGPGSVSARAQVRQMEIELLDLARSKEALQEDLPKRAIEEYKESLGFEMGLVWMGRVSLEYGYQLDLTRLQAWHPGVEIELDPFITLPEDADVTMVNEQPFDDSLPSPEE